MKNWKKELKNGHACPFDGRPMVEKKVALPQRLSFLPIKGQTLKNGGMHETYTCRRKSV